MSSPAYHPKLAAFQGIGRFGLLVHPGGEMPASDWREILQRLNVHLPILRVLVLWGDGSLTPGQRAYIETVQAATGLSTAVFTDSTVTRGLMKLKRWFGSRVEVFSKSQFEAGLLAFGVSRKDVTNLRRTIREMERMIDWSTNSSGRLPLKKPTTSRS
jgi:hypothetical protein